MGRFKSICSFVGVIVGLGLFAVGISLKWSIFPTIFEKLVYENVALEEGTEGYNAFVNPPVPVYMDFYFFTVKNPDEVSNGSKPILEEVGPYVYKEVRRKEDVLSIAGDRLQYSQFVSYSFEKEKTDAKGCTYNGGTCSDEDYITVLNGAFVGVISMLGPYISMIPPDYSTIVFNVVNYLLEYGDYAEEIFKTVRVSELLFDGYETGFLNATGNVDEVLLIAFDALGFSFNTIEDLLIFLENLSPGITQQYAELKIKLEELLNSIPQVAGGTFGIFKGKNATKLDSYYQINTGKFERHNFMEIELVNGKDKLPEEWWPSIAPTPTGQESGVQGICREIYGTDGQQFPPFLEKNTTLWIYVGELCRSLWMSFEGEYERQGVPVYRYRPAKDVFSLKNPNNYCYCPDFLTCAKSNLKTDEWDLSGCTNECQDGVLKVGNCYGGAPIVMTPPHFYKSDVSLIEAVEGMSPADPEIHDTFLDLEPYTGAAMAAHKRIQVNIPMTKIKEINLVSQVPDLIFPVLWADENAELDEENAEEFKTMVLKPIKIVDGTAIGLGIVCGILLTIISLFCLLRQKKDANGIALKKYSTNHS